MQLTTPILLLTFNRIETIKNVINEIRQAKPSKLYVASDGPRKTVDKENVAIQEVRDFVLASIDWDCEVKLLFQENNLGCKKAVSIAITWFFEHENEGIILEDDCVPSQSFFPFCQELLQIYKNDTRVMAISGDNYQYGHQRAPYSYYFSRYPHCWGWATWKRAWKFWDGDFKVWPEIDQYGFLKDILGHNEQFIKYWQNIFNTCHQGKIDSWAYPWTFSCWSQSGLTILPQKNLVKNIGFDSKATHTKKANSKLASLGAEEICLPLKHPPFMIRDSVSDHYTDINHFGLNQTNSARIKPLLGKAANFFKPYKQKFF